MNKKQIVFGALLGLPSLAMADVNFSIDDISIAKGETRTVYVNMEVTDQTVLSSFEFDVVLPNGLKFTGTDNVWKNDQATSTYGWTLSRGGSDQKYHFVGYTFKKNQYLNAENAKNIVALQFDVEATDDVHDSQITIENPEASYQENKDGDYAIDGDVNFIQDTEKAKAGKVEVIRRLVGKNTVTINNGLTKDSYDLTPKTKKEIVIEFNNPDYVDDPTTAIDEAADNGDPNVRSVQGVIHLPKGLSISDEDALFPLRTQEERFVVTDPVVLEDGSSLVSFQVFSGHSNAPLKSFKTYGAPVLILQVEGLAPSKGFDWQDADITIDNIIANKVGSGARYYLDDKITISVHNENQVAKDNTYDPKTEQLGKDYAAAVAAVDPWVKNSSKVLEQEGKAEKAIGDLQEEIDAQYENGVLHEWTDPDDLEGTANTEVENIGKVAGEQLEIAQGIDEAANKMIERAASDETDVPDYVNQYEKITPIKDERNENAGTLKNANDELAADLAKAKENGTLADDVSEKDAEKTISGLTNALEEQIEALKKAVEEALEAKEIEDAKATEALDAAPDDWDVPTIDGTNVSQDDADEPDGTYFNAVKEYNEAAADLKDAFGTDGTDGTVGKAGKAADLDVYNNLLEVVKGKLADVEEAIKALQKKAEENNAAAKKAYEETYKLPAEVANDDTPAADEEVGTWTKAKNALEQAVKDAEEAGTQARPGVYDKEIEDLKNALDAVLAKAKANNDLVDQALDVASGLLEIDITEEYLWNMNLEEVAKAADEFGAAYDALAGNEEKGIKSIKEEKMGDQAKDDVYKEALDRLTNAVVALQEALEAAGEQADANLKAAQKQLDTDFASERYDEVKDVDGIEDLKAAWEQAIDDLNDAIIDAKADGILDDDPSPLQEAIDEVIRTRNELNQAIGEATGALDGLDTVLNEEMQALLDAILGTDEKDGEMQYANVVNPETVEQPEGRINREQWQEEYDQLVNDIKLLVAQRQNGVETLKNQFLNGETPTSEIQSYLADGWNEDRAEDMAAAEKRIISYLHEVQRGDVDGDGRWTSTDYARLRQVILNKKYPAIDGETSTERYRFAHMDINEDEAINVGDAQAALNYAFYGSQFAPKAEARANSNVAENLTAAFQGNRIAVALTNAREYSAFQMDVVLPEGMSIKAQLAERNADFSIATNVLESGETRILVTAKEAGKAFQGNEGDILYIEVEGNGTVEFQNVIFSDLNTRTTQFQLNAVSGGTTGIAGVQTEGGVVDAIYNLGGRMVNGLKKGINIIRRADGTTQKVIKK